MVTSRKLKKEILKLSIFFAHLKHCEILKKSIFHKLNDNRSRLSIRRFILSDFIFSNTGTYTGTNTLVTWQSRGRSYKYLLTKYWRQFQNKYNFVENFVHVLWTTFRLFLFIAGRAQIALRICLYASLDMVLY